ncbi:hypothetical protein TWF506_000524 [Arthrobotrys conoides]|uniref:Uncharacterized protein n=1 Tax=Arthrobotrys conoides TaxID=74498 RepID=A0AAN8RXL6_9PEZI
MNPNFSFGSKSTETLDDYLVKARTASVTSTTNVTVNNAPPRLRPWFLLRTFLLIFTPILVTGLYLVIWLQFMVFEEGDLKFGNTDHQWLFYAWFVVATFGLSWSKDGLAGAEVAMLQTSYWQACSDTTLMMHMQNRWSGPAGWIYWILHIRSKGGLNFHKLFVVLSSISLLIFVGLPLSGLTINITEGFIASPTPPFVIGRTKENLYDRTPTESFDLLVDSWKIGSAPIVPGYGILYTPKNVSRGDYENLNKFPNTLPLTQSIPEVFLAPQAEYPISGRPWGIRAAYKCAIVEDASTFTILNERSSASYDWSTVKARPVNGPDPINTSVTLRTPSGNSISAFVGSSFKGTNIVAYAEIGRSVIRPESYDSLYNATDIDYNDHHGVLEYVVWQFRLKHSYNETEFRPTYKFNNTLEPTIRGMPSPVIQLDNGTWIRNTTFFQLKKTDYSGNPQDGIDDLKSFLNVQDFPVGNFTMRPIQSVAEPIGVRCEYTSAAGTAKLEPETSSFSSFIPEPPMWDVTQYRGKPLGSSAVEVLTDRFFDLFSSTGSPPPVAISNSPAYETFIQPRVLMKSIMLVFGLDALQIIYGGANVFEGAWRHENLTSSRKANVITPGVIPPYILLIFYGPWAVACLVIAGCYGFRPRLSDKLDYDSISQLREKLKNSLESMP